MTFKPTHRIFIDVDECAEFPCGDRADCYDKPSPQHGYYCVCKEYLGWTGNAGSDGSTCTGLSRRKLLLVRSSFSISDRNDCNATVCGSQATCMNNPAPKVVGNSCVCNTGYVGIAGSDGSNCTGKCMNQLVRRM